MTESKRMQWWGVVAGAALLTLGTFTPLVTPIGSSEPSLLEVPVTLWAGLLVSIGFVLLTYAATRSFPYRDADQSDDL